MSDMKRSWLFLLLWLPCSASAAPPATGMVVAAQPQAVAAGVQMLKAGGNAFDAAAATALALGVVEPASSGIGGGGFFLLYIAKQHRFLMIDGRETAPIRAGHGEIYATHSSIDGPVAAGVPGLPAAIDLLVRKYGSRSLRDIAAPAIRLAKQGFRVTPRLAAMIRWRRAAFNDAARRLFDKREGEWIRQPQLAETLQRFARHGARDFYTGETAGRLIGDLRHDGGLIQAEDLRAYRAVERRPIAFDWQGFHIVSAPLPSSGGLTLAHMFGQLSHDQLGKMSDLERAHLLIEVMKRAWRDRNTWLGDPAFVEIPADYLNPARLRRLRQSIRREQATPAAALKGFAEPSGNGMDTTHFSILDKDGNMVSATLSINYPFGSGYVSPATGIVLNDEMDDFATHPGKPNVYGLVQGKANAVAPGKRMLSSMTPTFVIGPHRTFIVGTPGGSRIISMVMLAALGFMLDQTPPDQWVNAPRFHHQYLPDVVQYEPGAFDRRMQTALKRRGHALKPLRRRYGNMQAILYDRASGKVTGISDARGEGVAGQWPR